MKNIKKIPFHIPSIGDKEINAIKLALEDNWLSEGKRVREFEKLFLGYSGGKYAKAVSSCTAALHVSNILSGADKGKKVIVPVYTFAASANSVIYSGAVPVFVDSSMNNPNVSVNELANLDIDKDYKALMVVNIGGIPCELSKLEEFAEGSQIMLIQDCSHSIESEYKGKPLGEYGDFACYSFHSTKNMTTSDGGMLVYKDKNYLEIIDQVIHHGMDISGEKRQFSQKPWDYEVLRLGYKYNMTDLQAVLGIAQLYKLRENYNKRERIYRLYIQMLENMPAIMIPQVSDNSKTSYHLFQVFIRSHDNPRIRDRIIEMLFEKGITCSIHFKPLHIHPFYRKLYGFREDDFPNSMFFYRSAISLPIFPSLKEEEILYICDTLKSIIKDLQL